MRVTCKILIGHIIPTQKKKKKEKPDDLGLRPFYHLLTKQVMHELGFLIYKMITDLALPCGCFEEENMIKMYVKVFSNLKVPKGLRYY